MKAIFATSTAFGIETIEQLPSKCVNRAEVLGFRVEVYGRLITSQGAEFRLYLCLFPTAYPRPCAAPFLGPNVIGSTSELSRQSFSLGLRSVVAMIIRERYRLLRSSVRVYQTSSGLTTCSIPSSRTCSPLISLLHDFRMSYASSPSRLGSSGLSP